jgi:hypothetical protein
MNYPYWLVLLLGLDRFGAVLLFNCPDMCISSLCWLVLSYTGHLQPRSPDEAALVMLSMKTLKLWAWQEELLILIGRLLERISPGHCLHSAQDELLTAARTTKLLKYEP